jgi:hypothetical protein
MFSGEIQMDMSDAADVAREAALVEIARRSIKLNRNISNMPFENVLMGSRRLLQSHETEYLYTLLVLEDEQFVSSLNQIAEQWSVARQRVIEKYLPESRRRGPFFWLWIALTAVGAAATIKFILVGP